MRIVHVLGTLVSIGFSTLVVVACSSPAPIPNDVKQGDPSASSSGGSSSGKTASSSGGAPSSSSGSTSSGSTSSGGSTSSSGSSGTPTGPDTAACSKLGADACFDCCFKGVDTTAMDNAYQTCMCGATGACKTECGNNACTGGQPSAACNTCAQSAKAQVCDDAAQTACDADTGCKAASACAESCPQN
jgi:hypothetical protein